MTVHDAKMHLGLNNFFEQIITDFQYKFSHHLIFLTISVKKQLLDRLQIKNMPISIIPLWSFGYNNKIINRDIDHKNPRILFFGRISKYKGVDLLIKSFLILLEKIPRAKLTIVGEKDSNVDLDSCINNKNITLIDNYISENLIGTYFIDSDVLVLPYVEGSQSGVIQIAKEYCLPTIATRVGGLVEQIDHLKTGILVSPDYRQIYLALFNLINDKKLYQSIVKSLFTVTKDTDEKNMDLLDKVLNK